MAMVFMKLLNMSISAGWLILAVILLRFLLQKAPKKLRCFLWAMVAVRLICPLSFESAWSLIPSRETIPADIVYARKPNVNTGMDAVDQIVNPIVESSFSPAELTSVNPIQIALWLGAWLWLAGMAAMLVYALVSYCGLYRKTRAALRLEGNVYLCDAIASPFVLGVIRPRILLPSELACEQLPLVIAHERSHLARLDHLWKPLGFAALTLHWFNPLVWLAYLLFCRDIELACDERVIANMDAGGKKAYSNALLACSVRPMKTMVCPLAFGEVRVRQRIQAVLSYKKSPILLSLLAILVCAAVAACFLTDPKGEELLPFGPADLYDLEQATLQGDFGEHVLTDPKKLRQLEEKLGAAGKMEANPVCPFEMTLCLQREDGSKGFLQLASDGCEVFYSDGVYYDYGMNKTGSVLSAFGFEPFSSEREYDEAGNVIREIRYDWFTPVAILEYSYEGEWMTNKTHRDGAGKLQRMESFAYNEQGWRIREFVYLADEEGRLNLDFTVELVYDEEGNFKETLYYNADGSLIEPEPDSTVSPGIISIYRH